MGNRLFELMLLIKRKCLSTEEDIREELALSQAEFNGLLTLEGKEQSGNTFSERMELSPSRGSRVLWRLISKGYVQTHTSDTDRRSNIISLSLSGRKMKKKIERRMMKCEGKIKSKLSNREIRAIKNALTTLVNAL